MSDLTVTDRPVWLTCTQALFAPNRDSLSLSIRPIYIESPELIFHRVWHIVRCTDEVDLAKQYNDHLRRFTKDHAQFVLLFNSDGDPISALARHCSPEIVELVRQVPRETRQKIMVVWDRWAVLD